MTTNITPLTSNQQTNYQAISFLDNCSFEEGDQFHLMVYVGGKPFAIDLSRLKEVAHCRVTGSATSASGIPHALSLRDGSIPVVDLCLFLTAEQGSLCERSSILIVEGSSNGRSIDIGFLVDRVGRLVVGEQCENDFAAIQDGRFTSGQLQLVGEKVSLLDIDELVRDITLESEYAC